jgi:ABC-2 type transport system ATP-binding protein
MAIIEVNNLVKKYKIIKKEEGIKGYLKHLIKPKYKEFKAVNGISFNIEEGELVGYIGENGAGKSTTIKMLTGLLTPTSGNVIINGIIPNEKRMQNNKNIGAVFGQKTQLWWDLPVIESFRLIKKMYKIPENEYRKNLKRFSEILDLDDLLEKQVKNLSLGQKMRCEIAATFLHNPKIVYLDEPTIGLDVFVKENIRKFIKDINKEKKTTVILTTHDLKDIEDVCNRIILLDKGQIIYDGSKQKFKDTYGKYVVAEFVVNNKAKEIKNNITLKNIEIIEESENKLKIKFNHEETTIVKIMDEISKYCTIEDIHMKEAELEDILKEIYKGAHKDVKNNVSVS